MKDIKQEKIVRFVDIDQTVFDTTAQIKIRDSKSGKLLVSLSNKEWNTYPREKLVAKIEQADFAEFADAKKFFYESKPIYPMIDKLRKWSYEMRTNPANYDDMVVFVTARGDFDNREIFLDTFRKECIAIDDSDHFYIARTGNLSDDVRMNGIHLSTSQRKKIEYLHYLMAKAPNQAELYDDDIKNIKDFLELKNEMPSIEFRAFLIDGDNITEVSNLENE